MQSLDNPAAYHVGLALLGVGGVFVLSSFLALGFTGTFLGKTLSVGGQGPAPPNSRPQPALLSAGGQTLKPQPAAWPPGWAGLLFLCSGLGLATGGGAGPSPCPWLRSFGAENPDTNSQSGTLGGGSRVADVRGSVGPEQKASQGSHHSRAMQETGASSQEEGPTGEVLWGPRSRWGSLCGPHRGGVGKGARGGRGGGVANLRRPGVSSPTAAAGERAARVWRRVGEGPGSRLWGSPRRNGLERGALRLRNVGQSGRVPDPRHEPP